MPLRPLTGIAVTLAVSAAALALWLLLRPVIL